MLSRLSIALLAMLALFVNNAANAWIVAAGGDNGYVHVVDNALSAEDAAKDALVECGKKSKGCTLFGKPVHGPVALAMVRGDEAQVVSTNRNPSLAISNAMKDCKVHYKNCRLDYVNWDHGARWDAIAMGDGGAHVSYNAESREQAESLAMHGCKLRAVKPDSCKLKRSGHSSEWIAVAESKTASTYAVDDTKNAAVALATKTCQNASKEPCDDITTFENAGPTDEPAALAQIKRDIERAKSKDGGYSVQAKPNTGNTTRYTESCRNADCVRRYQDGKTVRYMACLNPATGLPMSDPSQLGGCGGTDSRGNIFGVGGL
jgi:hypothetical protein